MEEKIKQLLKDDHSERYIEMALRQDRRMRLADPDAYGKRTGECGDTIEFFLRVRDGRIFQAMFDANGCINTVACANTVSILAEGKTVEAAWELTENDIIDYLGTLPPAEHHCAQLAVGAFYHALSSYGEIRRAPWKKFYGNP